MSEALQEEIEVLLEEMKEWEDLMSVEWSEAERNSFLEKKRDTLKNFFLNEVQEADKAQLRKQGVDTALTEDEIIEAEARRQIEQEALAAVAADASPSSLEDAFEAEIRAKAEEDQAFAAKKAAEEKAAAEKAATEKVAAEKAVAAKKAAEEKAASDKLAAAERAATTATSPRSTLSSSASTSLQNLASSLDAEALLALDNAALEKELKDAQLRITKNPSGRQPDLTDPSVLSTYIRLRNDRDELNWMMLGYPAADLPNKITVIGSGSGGWKEMLPQLPEDPIFLYFDYKFGDTGRSKFIFMTYVPDSLAGMKKSRVVGHRPAVEKLLKYMQLSWHVLERTEFSEEVLIKKLLAAGGANYSVQESDKGDFSSYKKTTANFYTETEKKGNLGSVVYQAGPLTTTPMDISGRAMVAPSAEFRNNLVDLK